MNCIRFPGSGVTIYPEYDGLVIEFATDNGYDFRVLTKTDAINLAIRLPEFVHAMNQYSTSMERRAKDDDDTSDT